jgi:predicted PurR-regulated permease PerM
MAKENISKRQSMVESGSEECAKECKKIPRTFELGTVALAVLAMVVVLVFGMLPMMFGLLGARAASLAVAGWKRVSKGGPKATLVASLLVGLIAFGSCAGLVAWGAQSAKAVAKEVPAIAKRLAEQTLEWKANLPSVIADRIPEDDQEVQQMIADAITAQMPGIAGAGKSWANGAMLAIIGWVIGLLMANVRPMKPNCGPLAQALRAQGRRFSGMFNQIVAAQFLVACANTFFAAIFMFVILPLSGNPMPWAPALVALTMVLSMLPVAGNVVCNGIVTLVALSVGPGLAVASLVYLIVVHKIEYFINAKVVGAKVDTSIWELLLAMFVLEAIFGIGGLVAAPLFYAYGKKELKELGWV